MTWLAAWLTTIATILCIYLQMRKVWWAPIFGLAQEGLWVWLMIVTKAYPMLIAVAAYSVIFACAIPKWYRERPRGRN